MTLEVLRLSDGRRPWRLEHADMVYAGGVEAERLVERVCVPQEIPQFVTLEVLKLRGWLKALAPLTCFEHRGGSTCHHGNEGSGGTRPRPDMLRMV